MGADGRAVTVASVMHAAGLAVGADGSLFVAAAQRLLRITPQGQATAFADGFEQAVGLAFDVHGDLYVSDAVLNGVARIRGFAQGTLQGRARLANGTPVPGARVQVLSDWPIVVGANAVTSADGSFRMLVAPGAYMVTVTRTDGCPAAQGVSVAAGATQNLDVVFRACWRAFLPVALKPGG
jgi:hypothetical protein